MSLRRRRGVRGCAAGAAGAGPILSFGVRRITRNPLAQYDVAGDQPPAGFISFRVGDAAAASAGELTSLSRGEARIVVKQELVEIVRTAADLDDVHVNVLRRVAVGIPTGPNRVELKAARGIGSRPTAQSAVTSDGCTFCVLVRRIKPLRIRVIRVHDHAADRAAPPIANGPLDSHRFARLAERRDARRGRRPLWQTLEDGFATFARQADDRLSLIFASVRGSGAAEQGARGENRNDEPMRHGRKPLAMSIERSGDILDNSP